MMIGLILLSVLLAAGGYLRSKRLSNPVTVFNLLWAFIFLLYALRLRPYDDVTMRTGIVFYLQMLGFAAGAMLTERLTIAKEKPGDRTSRSLNLPVFIALSAVTLVILAAEVLPVIRHLMAGHTLYDIAAAGISAENSASGLMVPLKIFVMFPTVYASSAVAAVEVVLEKSKRRWLVFALNIAMVALYVLQHGERTLLYLFIVTYLFAWRLKEERLHITAGQGLKLALAAAAALFVMDALTRSRGSSLSGTAYSYFAGIVPHADKRITSLCLEGVQLDGAASLYGFYAPFVILLSGLGLLPQLPEFYQTAGAVLRAPADVVSIGSGVRFNAFVGPSYALYADGGMIAVFLGMLVYGFVCTDLYLRAQTGSVRTRSLYLLMMCTLATTFFQIAFCEYKFPMALLLILVLYGKRKGKIQP